jgi:poly [ADP-ribose] polymerase
MSTNLKIVKLICVEVNEDKKKAGNSNKFYHMFEQVDGNFKVEYGRVDVTKQTETYPMSKWETKYNEKIKKGYADQTHLFAKKTITQSGGLQQFADITDQQIKKLVDTLQGYANKSIKANYTIAVESVTQMQVDEAQNIINNLTNLTKPGTAIEIINKQLLKLYSTIPRRMQDVRDHILKTSSITLIDKTLISKLEKMLSEEQATLDVMRGQVQIQTQQIKSSNSTTKDIALTLLDVMGLKIEPTDANDITTIKKLLGANEHQFKSAVRITNIKTYKSFHDFLTSCKNKKRELFWHGSRNENFWSILQNGLVLYPANAVISGKMFGFGLYFADKAQKSIGYTSLRGSYFASGTAPQAFLAVFDVHVGEQYHIKHHQSWCYDLNEKNLKAQGAHYDSLFAEGGADLRNNEYIVYRQEQATIKYLVEIG